METQLDITKTGNLELNLNLNLEALQKISDRLDNLKETVKDAIDKITKPSIS